MKEQSSNINWKTAAIVGAIAITTSVGVYYYLQTKKKLRTAGSIDIDENDNVALSETHVVDPRQDALRIKEKGNIFYKCGRYESAIESYTSALDLCPGECKQDRAILFQNRAVAYENIKMQDKSLLDLNEALSLNPKYEKALIRRSRIYEDRGDIRQALIDITAASIFNNFKTPEWMNRMEQIVKSIASTEVEKELTVTPVLQSDLYIQTYLDSFPSDPLMSSEPIYEPVMPELAGDGEERPQACLTLLRLGQYEACFEAVQEALTRRTEFSEEIISRLLLLRGTLYILSCREDLALTDLIDVTKNSYARPSVTVNALIKRAMLAMVGDDAPAVERSFTEALQIDPTCPDIYYHRGSYFEASERIQEAINDYKRALELRPTYSFAAVHRIFNEFRLNMGQNLYDEFKILIRQFPNCIECNIIFAQVLLSEGRNEEAEQILENLLSSLPKSGVIMATYAMVKLSQNKISEARKILVETIKEDPKCSYSYNTLATIFIKDGDLQKALELLDQAVKHARNRQEMQNFIATREGVRAQLAVSAIYKIPPKEIFASILQGMDMQPNASYL